MSTPNDELWIWTLNRMPLDVVDLSIQLNPDANVNELTTDGTDHIDSTFHSRGPVATLRTSVILFIIECCLPENQRYVWYWLFFYSRQIFIRKIYVIAYVQIFLLWYFPWFPPKFMYYLTVGYDAFRRSGDAMPKLTQQEVMNTCTSQISQLSFDHYIIHTAFDPDVIAGWLERLVGPMHLWPRMVFPILFGLTAVDERAPINACTPEVDEGMVMAAALWGSMKILPKWAQWALWLVYSAPDSKNPNMTVRWAIYTLVWIWFDIPVPIAYGLYLFTNQFPQIEFGLRYAGGAPSRILRRERHGLLCFVGMSLLLRYEEICSTERAGDLKWLTLPLKLLVLTCAIIASVSHYFRVDQQRGKAEFKHRPLQGSQKVRLLRLRPRYFSRQQKLHCDLLEIDLASPPQYTAISYCWGDVQEDSCTIAIDGAPFTVSKNLHTLLLAKQKVRHNVLLWIDAICINQFDANEKSQQIGLMRRIFEEASSTLGWLGDDSDAPQAFATIQRYNQASESALNETSELSSQLGWKELAKFLDNPWFERVWIIQEIAMGNNPRLRYGNQEIEWEEVIRALSLLLARWSASGLLNNLLDNSYIVNALVIENIRGCIQEVDYLHLEDVLKLGLVSRATLPVDKVFALLGVAEERNRSVLGLDYAANVSNLEAWHAKNLFRDLYRTVDAIHDIKGTLTGMRGSRRSWRIRGHRNGVKYLNTLMKDEARILHELKWLAKKRKGIKADKGVKVGKSIPYDRLRPEYSKQTTPESVYLLVAKIAISKGNAQSVLRHAGIGNARNAALPNLPSWVPDWSSLLCTFILPSRKLRDSVEVLQLDPPGAEPLSKPNQAAESQEAESVAPKSAAINVPEPIDYKSIHQPSFGFHTVQGQYIGTVLHLAALSTELLEADLPDVVEAARHDFYTQFTNHMEALSMAQLFCRYRYDARETIETTFFRSIMADVGADSLSPAPHAEMACCKDWTYGQRDDCPIFDTLHKDHKAHPDQPSESSKTSSDTVEKQQASPDGDSEQSVPQTEATSDEDIRICKKYLTIRRMQSSTSSKFAHMVRTEILPSFEKYRFRDDDTGKVKTKATSASNSKTASQGKHISFFDDPFAGPLSAYKDYVDYTIGRKFAIFDGGYMGLVPSGAQEGDLVIHDEAENMFLVLRKAKPMELRRAAFRDGRTKSAAGEMYRFVGEAHVQDWEDSGQVQKDTYTLW